MVFGKNPDLPTVFTDEPPALESRTVIEMFAKYLNALHAACRDFIRSEACECVRRELRHKIRAASQKFSAGDNFYYKREDSSEWRGHGLL